MLKIGCQFPAGSLFSFHHPMLVAALRLPVVSPGQFPLENTNSSVYTSLRGEYPAGEIFRSVHGRPCPGSSLSSYQVALVRGRWQARGSGSTRDPTRENAEGANNPESLRQKDRRD